MARPARSLLPWIIGFKAFKAVTLTALGLTLLATRRSDPVDVVWRLAMAVHLPLTSRVFDRALRFALNLSVAKQTALAVTAFGYAALMSAEAIALHLRRLWARWFTIGATASLIPIEVYEIVREVHVVRVVILAVNIAVVIYLARRRELFEEGSR
jgi:uncharacterized membrane protein (DUF2068 family)